MSKRFKKSQKSRGVRVATIHRAPRRGIALYVTMFFVAAIGALALASIYLSANATLLSKSFEKEDDLKYASEFALEQGKSALNFNPAALPNTSYVAMMTNKTLTAADAQPIAGVKVNLWVGPTGSTSGQFGRFASLVSQSIDASGNSFVRRLELTQESFAKFAYWSNSENTAGGGIIYFGSSDALWGPVWSNDTISISASGATFHDLVSTAAIISGTSFGTFAHGYEIHQKPIALPSMTSLSSLPGLATASGFNFTAPTTGDETTVRMRIEFVAADMDASHDSTGANEGFFRVYTATAGNTAWLRANWPGTATALPATSAVINCGDWHTVAGSADQKFFPVSVHATSWFRAMVEAGGLTHAAAQAESIATVTTILQHPHARCFLGGDPHLVAVSRTVGLGYTAAQINKGGDDTTFTAIDQRGAWTVYTATPNGTIAAARPADAKYLFPLYRGFNTGTKGVIYVAGTVGISGVLRGDITLYSPNTVVVLGDQRYANDPATGVCLDILGVIAGGNVVVADNSINSPQWVKTTATVAIQSLDVTPDLSLHAVIMALGNSFYVENYAFGATNTIGCEGTANGRGCLYLTGGLIQNIRGAVGTSSGTGYIKRYSYDHCAVVNPPPYFPTTGRFQDNRYYEIDPVKFSVAALYRSLTPR